MSQKPKIGTALYELLTSLSDITDLVGERITPIVFDEEGTFPALVYNTRKVKTQACRGGSKTKEGVLEIGLMANNATELETLTDAVSDALDAYEGTHGGYSFTIDVADEDFDESADELRAYYKALQFDFTATKL